MGWRCPECGKTFRNTNQWHSCYRLDQSAHLINKPEHIIEAYKKLLEAIAGFGDVEINSIKTAIQISAGATFLTIKVKSDHIILEFQLNHAINDFPVHKTIRISGKRVLHYAYVQDAEDINEPLLSWLKDSYKLVAG